MTTPAITLVATLQDVSGNDIGSAANPAALRIALCGFGDQIPRIVGTCVIAQPGPIFVQAEGSQISLPVWGNDAITPAGTFYDIALLDGNGNVVQSDTYQLTGSGTQELSALTPYLPTLPLPSPYVVVTCTATMAFNAGGWPGPITFETTLTTNVTAPTLSGLLPGQWVQFKIKQGGSGNYSFTWPSNVKNPPIVEATLGLTTTASFFMALDGSLYPTLGVS
jgi:hypothetical protein